MQPRFVWFCAWIIRRTATMARCWLYKFHYSVWHARNFLDQWISQPGSSIFFKKDQALPDCITSWKITQVLPLHLRTAWKIKIPKTLSEVLLALLDYYEMPPAELQWQFFTWTSWSGPMHLSVRLPVQKLSGKPGWMSEHLPPAMSPMSLWRINLNRGIRSPKLAGSVVSYYDSTIPGMDRE